MVRPLIEAAVQMFFHTASAKGLHISCTVDDGVAAAHLGDALRIRQILSNFITNAVKFTAAEGVGVAVRAVGDLAAPSARVTEVIQRLEFSVTDTGIGVAPEKQRELFKEFVKPMPRPPLARAAPAWGW